MSKEEKQIKEIKDNDLDTGRDLVTENYQLEILTLKDKVDLRRFSRAFLKVDKLLKNIFSNKLDKGEYGGNAQDLKNDIDNNAPSKFNQVFSNHYYHELYGGNTVYEHAFTNPKEYVAEATRKVTRVLDDKNIAVEFIMDGKSKSFKLGNLLFYREGTHDNPNNKLDKTANILIGKDRGLDSSTDLNTIIESGMHQCGALTHAQFNNVKISVDFYGYGLFVVTRQGAFCSQTYYAHAYGLILSRVCYITDMVWSDWVPQYTTLNKPTPEDIGAVNKGGDTIKGPLKVERKVGPEGSISMIPKENYTAHKLFAATRYKWYEDVWDVGAYRGGSTDISSLVWELNGMKRLELNTDGVLILNAGHIGNNGDPFIVAPNFHYSGVYVSTALTDLLNRVNSTLPKGTYNLTAGDLKSDIDRNSPSASNQLFSDHYYHRLHANNIVYEHAYPGGVTDIVTEKQIRCLTGSGAEFVAFQFKGDGSFISAGDIFARGGGSKVYHQGFKPTPDEIGALPKSYCPHRVGDIIPTTNAEHPATTWIGTQWERYGDGKVIVGLSESEVEFNTIGKTGGTKTHLLTEAELASHVHITVAGGGYSGQGGPSYGQQEGSWTKSTTSNPTGGNQPHNNLQPYIVVYRWRRTA